jgi:hypothetical protein
MGDLDRQLKSLSVDDKSDLEEEILLLTGSDSKRRHIRELQRR